ncbi:MAG TPA: virulence RhuM family protein [Bryobacteraceae bacterium]|nr:virulence RhuM family protein [Bryobacteraceae bacterium]
MNSRGHVPRLGGEIVVYRTEDGDSRIRVLLEGETVWLTQTLIAELYETTVPNVSIHLKHIYTEGELAEGATIKDCLIVRNEGGRQVSRRVRHYNLEAILAVGYRVQSPRGTQFRQWATARLNEHLVKGFTLDDERLKGGAGLVDYFDELLARIREIRASEARVYQRIREIFALASDYLEGEDETQRFFAMMQNKMHHAATGMTAAEIIRRRADHDKANMGLTSWKGGRALKRDVGTAKNYLDAAEIDTLNRITVMFLDQAEFRAQRRQDIRMRDWEGLLDKFLRDTELPVLDGPGTVSHEAALDWAYQQYDAFIERRRLAAEAEAGSRYLEDLQDAARVLETGHGKARKSEETKRQSKNTKKKNSAQKTSGRGNE